jgi:hypothetical protein
MYVGARRFRDVVAPAVRRGHRMESLLRQNPSAVPAIVFGSYLAALGAVVTVAAGLVLLFN